VAAACERAAGAVGGGAGLGGGAAAGAPAAPLVALPRPAAPPLVAPPTPLVAPPPLAARPGVPAALVTFAAPPPGAAAAAALPSGGALGALLARSGLRVELRFMPFDIAGMPPPPHDAALLPGGLLGRGARVATLVWIGHALTAGG
jgi:hypothetical protein